MGAGSTIEWTDHTFNPWIGCTRVSPGCDHCYAARYGARFGVAWGPDQMRRRTSDAYWKQPIAWDRRAEREGRRYRVFCASLADVFDNAIDQQWRHDLFALIYRTPSLDWLLLTKRIGNAGAMLPWGRHDVPWRNVWLGATVVNQEEANRDIPKLLKTPAAVRFISVEPMLGPIDLERGGWSFLRPLRPPPGNSIGWPRGVDWVIVGGESGPQARPTDVEHIRAVVTQCKAADVPVFVKQLGARPSLLDRKGGDPDEWPEDLRVREFKP